MCVGAGGCYGGVSFGGESYIYIYIYIYINMVHHLGVGGDCVKSY